MRTESMRLPRSAARKQKMVWSRPVVKGEAIMVDVKGAKSVRIQLFSDPEMNRCVYDFVAKVKS